MGGCCVRGCSWISLSRREFRYEVDVIICGLTIIARFILSND